MSALIPIMLAATIPLRNPFWPVGYAGEREAISEKPRVQIKTAAEAQSEDDTRTSVTAEAIAAAEAEADDAQYQNRLWIAARKSLRIGGTMRSGAAGNGRQSVTINGNIYGDGDLVSANFDGRRFTWKVKNLTDGGTLKLQRIKFRALDEEADDKGEQ